MYPDDFLNKKLEERKTQHAFRQLRLSDGVIDFCSNDYLGIVHDRLLESPPINGRTGSTGSRLLAGNYRLIEEVEKGIASFHASESALIFNSGYDANVGLLASVPQKEDTILYDQLSHASLRDGIRLSFAKSYSFLHNDLEDLRKKIRQATGTVFIVTESVFSMDGDTCPLSELIEIATEYAAHLVIDEAHASGVIGAQGEGLVQHLGLQDKIFARIHTFGKALGCHGAVVLGSSTLRHYLINFARSLIYTTALPEHSIELIRRSYNLFPGMRTERQQLTQLIRHFQQAVIRYEKLVSQTPVQGVVVPGNEHARALAAHLQEAGLDVRPILYPTVPKGGERLRIVLHSYNTPEELDKLLKHLQ
jgi:8-amino-7-oxononanoate synthase